MKMLRLVALLWLVATPVLAQELEAEAEFRTLWWSKEQMVNFNPNRPPPKATEVVIDRWEYSDPVGVPHPDEVAAQITVRNKGPKSSFVPPNQWVSKIASGDADDGFFRQGVRFASGAGNSFTVSGPEIGRDSMLIGAGLAIHWNDRISTYALRLLRRRALPHQLPVE